MSRTARGRPGRLPDLRRGRDGSADGLAGAAARLRAVLDVSRALVGLDDEVELLALIASSACRCLGYGGCAVAVRDAAGWFDYRATAGVSPDVDRALRALQLSQEGFDLLRAAATPLGSVLYIPPRHPVRQHPAVKAGTISTPASACGAWEAGALLLVPLIGHDGEIVGFLNPDDPLDGNLPTGGQVAVLETFAHQAVVALEVVRGRAAERERIRRAEAQQRQLEGLLQASASVRGSLRRDEILQQIAAAMASAGGFEGVVIYLYDAATDLLHARAMVGLSDGDAARLANAPVPLSAFHHFMRPEMGISRSYLFDHRCHSAPQDFLDALSTPDLPDDWREGQWHPEDSLTIPLIDGGGRYLGLISVDQPADRAFPDLTRIQALELFADQCVVAVEHARLYEEMQQLALTDALTGLPNRALLRDRLQQAATTAQRDATSLALLLLDLNHFKEVNDTLGHHYGDLLLCDVASRLRAAVRASDTVARLGGDEFAVVLPETDEAGASAVARAILGALDHPVIVEGHTLDVGASIGIVVYPDHGCDVSTLLRRVDVAMYVAKRSHSGYRIYTLDQDQHNPQRLALMTALRQSLDDDELQIHYQPLVDLSSGRVRGVEALLRWTHREHGLVPPDQFIRLAEHTGLILPLTRWVLEAALRQARAWRQAGLPLAVSVNLSVRTLHDIHLPETVGALLRKHEIAAEYLTLEVTESGLMADPERAQEVLTQLAHMGVRISIDDFGTGYSSLAYLKSLPVHEIKIDKSFVLNLGAKSAPAAKDVAIVRSIVAMARALGLEVVAEGVELQSTWQVLRVLGCDLAQGYLISRPLPADHVALWLRSSA